MALWHVPAMCLGLSSELKLEGHKEGGKEAIVVVGGGNFQSAGWQCPHGGGQIVRHLSARGSIPGMRETTLKGILVLFLPQAVCALMLLDVSVPTALSSPSVATP